MQCRWLSKLTDGATLAARHGGFARAREIAHSARASAEASVVARSCTAPPRMRGHPRTWLSLNEHQEMGKVAPPPTPAHLSQHDTSPADRTCARSGGHRRHDKIQGRRIYLAHSPDHARTAGGMGQGAPRPPAEVARRPAWPSLPYHNMFVESPLRFS